MNLSQNNSYNSAFFIVPSDIIRLPGITLAFLKVYETIFQFWNHRKHCFLSLSSLCERTELSKSQVCEALLFFEKNNELIRKNIDGKRYFLQPQKGIPVDDDTAPEKLSGCPVERTGGVRQSGLVESGGADHNKKNINNKNINNKTYVDSEESPSRSEPEYTFDELFMLFYLIYPNKQKPRIAYKAFLKLNVTQEFADMLIQDVTKRKNNNWKGLHKSKIPHPATYLNSREWEGEIYAPDTVKSTKPRMTAADVYNTSVFSKEDIGMGIEYTPDNVYEGVAI